MAPPGVSGVPVESLRIIGGSLYVLGCDVEICRDGLVLDVDLKNLDPTQVETVIVKLGGVEIAALPTSLG